LRRGLTFCLGCPNRIRESILDFSFGQHYLV
jgi:hypothetical protein